MIDAVFDFHAFALQRGYLAVGFYDGNLIADFATGLITVCGIDWYRPLPALNDWGRMPGSSRFLSPEEYTAGAPLDEITLQYTMGALAFFFFGRRESREREDWTAGEALFRVAEQACREDRAGRFSSYVDFLSAWRQAAGRTVP